MTHEPVRGTLALFGLPDERSGNLAPGAAAAFLTARQFNNSRGLGRSGAEIVTIGHRTADAAYGAAHAHIALPGARVESASSRVLALVEDMFDSWERMLAMQVFLNRVAEGVSKLRLFRYDRSRTKDQVFAPTTASPVSAATVYERLDVREPRQPFPRVALPFDVVVSSATTLASIQRTLPLFHAPIGSRAASLRSRSEASAEAAPGLGASRATERLEALSATRRS